MLLDEIKDIIKELEDILIKDPRFKKEVYFKKSVRTIYECKKNNIPYRNEIQPNIYPAYLTTIGLDDLMGKPKTECPKCEPTQCEKQVKCPVCEHTIKLNYEKGELTDIKPLEEEIEKTKELLGSIKADPKLTERLNKKLEEKGISKFSESEIDEIINKMKYLKE